jgi:ATP-binding cassette subfamily E protein 1
MRFRDEIKFGVKPPSSSKKVTTLIEYPKLVKDFGQFRLEVDSGTIKTPQILGILGPNATGKTTFMKMLAGEQKPDAGAVELNVKVSYKPQYIQPSEEPVASLGVKGELIEKFRMAHLLEKKMTELSGGELQRVAIADCLSRQADVYLLDEPSAYLDVEERLSLAKYLHSFGYDQKVAVIVIEHDILLIDYLSDELLIFEGESGRTGRASKPLHMREGMNVFLKQMDTTFRRDPDTGRPRANKPASVKDREQKGSGEYYYSR